MNKILTIPTDNLNKFMATAGAVLCVLCLLSVFWLVNNGLEYGVQHERTLSLIRTQGDLYKVENKLFSISQEKSDSAIEAANTSGKEKELFLLNRSKEIYTDRMKELENKVDDVISNYELLKSSNGHIIVPSIFGIALLLMGVGFSRWRKDEVLKEELLLLERDFLVSQIEMKKLEIKELNLRSSYQPRNKS